MTTVAIFADTHARTGKRFDEHQRVMRWCAADVVARGVDLVCHAGDIYDGRSDPMERAAVAEWCRAITDHCPPVVVGGNHEQPGDVEALGRLRTRHPIVATETPLVTELAGIAVACLPWPRKAYLLAALGQPVDPAVSDAVAVDCLRNVLRGLRVQLDQHEGPRLLVAHAMVDGSNTNHDQPLIGCELAMSVADLALAGAHFNALGHIHCAVKNDWATPVPTGYAASPIHHSYGEPGFTGYILVHFDGTGLVNWERIPTPARPMHLLTGRDADGKLEVARPEALADAEIRVRYDVAEAERAAGAVAARELKASLIAAGAADVQLEPIVAVASTVRHPEVVAASTVEDQLRARWQKRTVPEDRQAAMLSLLTEVAASVG